MTRESLMTFFRSRLFAGIVTGIGIVLIALCIFEAGVIVGYHEAQFSARWGENYGRNFGGPGSAMGLDEHLPSGHGAVGTIVSVASSTITIASGQKQEQKIVIGTETIIRENESTLTASQLAAGMSVVVLGTPDAQGEIQANFIRVVPAPGTAATTTTP